VCEISQLQGIPEDIAVLQYIEINSGKFTVLSLLLLVLWFMSSVFVRVHGILHIHIHVHEHELKDERQHKHKHGQEHIHDYVQKHVHEYEHVDVHVHKHEKYKWKCT
jgi:Na+-transporting methylmalonyl-CoA/oxaloacetate decarboxylase gamma subunit